MSDDVINDEAGDFRKATAWLRLMGYDVPDWVVAAVVAAETELSDAREHEDLLAADLASVEQHRDEVEAERDAALTEVQACRTRLSAHSIETVLLQHADQLDPDEGPVVLAWGVKQLAETLACDLAEGLS
ncbi:hypothetical protein [uncultured Jatrophihabitans sp.]|uniref:hypothetical protein n=1 Tax=uncultured Jatrophihabitans sp. TaxID=1610747 RepID=UPI0035CC846C